MLTTIHVSLVVNGATVKRPLRVYDARDNAFGVVLKGECHRVKALTPNTVALVKGSTPRAKDGCRNAKLADLGIAAKPLPNFIKARKAQAAEAPVIAGETAVRLTPELVAQLIAMLNSAHA